MDTVSLLDGGAQAFPAALAALAGARRSVWMEVYTFELDGWGSRMAEALCAAAARGVKVRVQVDGVGSFGSRQALSAKLTGSGVEVRTFNPLTGLFTGRLWRNHRKLLVVDDEVAFVGGINVSDAYASDDTRPGWADLALELRGKVAAELGARLRGARLLPPEGPVRVWLSGLRGGLRLQGRYRAALEGAKAEVVLAHAYFLPSGAFVRQLCAAARRGVKVRLLLAGKSDVPLARAATARLYGRLLGAGVEVREWTGSTLHAKAAVVDGHTVLLGSFNLDALSLVNQEALVEVEDPALGGEVRAWMERHLAGAVDVAGDWQEMPWLRRAVLGWVGTLVVRVQAAVARLLSARDTRAP